jgi:hypothetical protein
MGRVRLPTNIDDATHTLQRLIERRIGWDEVIAVVSDPDKTVPGHSGRTNHYRVVSSRRLRVTIDATGQVWTAAHAGDKP